jgi:hypothetical protein
MLLYDSPSSFTGDAIGLAPGDCAIPCPQQRRDNRRRQKQCPTKLHEITSLTD